MAKDNISDKRALDLIERAFEIEKIDARESGQIGYVPRLLVQTCLPYRDAKTQMYQRQNGDVRLTLMSPNGVPYGSIPRFLVSYIATEAVRNGSPEIGLGHSQADFLKMLGMNTAGGAQKARLKNQATRFFTTVMSVQAHCAGSNFDQIVTKNVLIAKSAYLLWHPKEHNTASLWESSMVITDEFYKECIDHPIPIDMRVMDVLSPSPFAMDVYPWLAMRVKRATRMSVIPWEMLIPQFGCAPDTEKRTFRRYFVRALKQVMAASNWTPSVTVDDDALTIFPGQPPIPPALAKRSLKRGVNVKKSIEQGSLVLRDTFSGG